MTEDEAKAELKSRQAGFDALASAKNSAVEEAVRGALNEIHAMRENLASTQARSTQLIDESRGLRRVLLAVADKLMRLSGEQYVDEPHAADLVAIACLVREAAKVPPCT